MKNIKGMTLNRTVSIIPGNQYIIVKDYLSGAHYADDKTNQVIDKVLDYNQELRNSQVYGISIEGNNIICIEVLIKD